MQDQASWRGLLAASAALALALAFGASAAEPPKRDSATETPKRDTRSPTFDELMPRWDLGDRWVVETISRPLQLREEMSVETVCRPIQWQFAVRKFEKALTDDCYRVEIKCLLGGARQPATVLWIDRKSKALRKIQTQLPVPGGFQTVTQSFEFSSGQPSPVLGPLTALPVDLPLFIGGEAKGMQTFAYETHLGTPGVKNVGELGFAHQIEQRVTPVAYSEVKGLLNDSYAKSLTEPPTVEVRLKDHDRQVRQLWQPGLPWPVYTNAGSTVCRLVKVIPAGQENEDEGGR